jgi:ribonuclease HII
VVDQILKDLEKELRALLESKSLSGAERAQLKALVAEAESAIHPAYAAAAKSLDTQALAIIVAEKTVEAMEAFPVSALMPSVERLASLTKDVLIDGAPSSAWWERQAEDTAFKFAAQVGKAWSTARPTSALSSASPASEASRASWRFLAATPVRWYIPR